MKILIAVAAAQRHHTLHPKMVGEWADQANGLFEAMLDFEAQTIKTNDVDGTQRKIRAHQQKRPSGGGHEANELSGRAPQQVANTIAKHDLVLTVNRTGRLVHRLEMLQQRFDLDLFPVAPGRSPFPPSSRRFGGLVDNRVGFDTAQQMMTLA